MLYYYYVVLIARGSAVFEQGCWIGLKKINQQHQQIVAMTTGSSGSTSDEDVDDGDGAAYTKGLFLDFQHNELIVNPTDNDKDDNSATINEYIYDDIATASGNNVPKQCILLAPWQQYPLVLEQGSWKHYQHHPQEQQQQLGCHSLRPFICQIFADTTRYTLNVTSSVLLQGKKVIIEGGRLLITASGTSSSSSSAAAVQLLELTASYGANIIIAPSSASTTATTAAATLGSVLLTDGSKLSLSSYATATAIRNAYIGEIYLNSTTTTAATSTVTTTSAAASSTNGEHFAMQPQVVLARSATLTLTSNSSSQSVVTINAAMITQSSSGSSSRSSLILGANTELVLLQVSAVYVFAKLFDLIIIVLLIIHIITGR